MKDIDYEWFFTQFDMNSGIQLTIALVGLHIIMVKVVSEIVCWIFLFYFHCISIDNDKCFLCFIVETKLEALPIFDDNLK